MQQVQVLWPYSMGHCIKKNCLVNPIELMYCLAGFPLSNHFHSAQVLLQVARILYLQ